MVRQKSLINPNFEQFEAQNDLFLTIFAQNQTNFRMTRIQKFQLQLYYTNHISTKEMEKNNNF